MKRLKVYLDTNVIYGYFKRRIEEVRDVRRFEEPETIKFLRERKELIKSLTSFFTLLEVAENITKNYNVTIDEIIKLFRFFRNKYPVKILDKVRINEEILKWYFSGMEFKDTIQLSIAKNEDIWFISGDKKCVELAKIFYKKSLTFQELKEIVSSF